MHKETFCTPKVSNDTSMLQKTMQCTISDALHFMFYNIFSGKSVQFNHDVPRQAGERARNACRGKGAIFSDGNE